MIKMKRLFIDMDGTLADFYADSDCLEKMWEKGFFAGLKPYPNILEAMLLFKKTYPQIELFIASSVIDTPYCVKEKNEWLNQYLPIIDRQHRYFPAVGLSKGRVVKDLNKNDYLLDDYNHGLEAFIQDGGSGIKFKNNINHKGKIGTLWQGDIISYEETPQHIVSHIAKIMVI